MKKEENFKRITLLIIFVAVVATLYIFNLDNSIKTKESSKAEFYKHITVATETPEKTEDNTKVPAEEGTSEESSSDKTDTTAVVDNDQSKENKTDIEKANIEVATETGKMKVTYFLKGDKKTKYYYEDNTTIDNGLTNKMLAEYNIPPNTLTKSNIWPLVIQFVLIGAMIFLLLFMFRRNGSGGEQFKFGKSRARLSDDASGLKKVTFDDVAGIDEVKEELEEIIEYLKKPDKYTAFNAKIPKGVMLYGAPGTGKTLIAKAVAGESGVPFYSISGSDFVEMFVGVGASRVRDMFEVAKKNAPCIIFIDEIDAVGRQRGAGLGGGHDEREQTLNQLLVQMDGFEEKETVIVIAATNRPDILDKALLRPGRFDRQIVVGSPDVKGREEILKVHAANKPLGPDVDLSIIAKRTPGFSGADLANVVNEAALLSVRKELVAIDMETLEQAIEREIAGPEKKSKIMSDKEKKLVAFHEAGHAVVTYYLEGTDPVHKISIVPRGLAGGYTLSLPDEDKNYVTKTDMLNMVSLLLGGRIAEDLVLHDISTGASNDLERATNTIRSMITEYGMTNELGSLTFGQKSGEVFLGRDYTKDRNYSETTAGQIDQVARKYMDYCYGVAEKILKTHMDKLNVVAQALLDHEVVSRDEFEVLMNVK